MTSLPVKRKCCAEGFCFWHRLETAVPSKCGLLSKGDFVSSFSDGDTKDFCLFLEATVTKLNMLLCCRGL